MRKGRRAIAASALLLFVGWSLSKQSLALPPGSSTPSADEAQQGLSIACSPAKPTAWPGETIALQAFLLASNATPRTDSPIYVWGVNSGKVAGKGPTTSWNLSGVSPGSCTATVRANTLGYGSAECSLQVVVQEARRGVEPLPRESGRSLLVEHEAEQDGYGLYSYLLFGSPPAGDAQERYAQAMTAYWQLMPSVKDLEEYLPRRELNVTYVPVDMAPGSAASALWALQHYDYARARVLLRVIPGDHREGPYIISSLKPIPANAPLDGPYLYQDLSSVPPQLVSFWVKEFLNQAAQQHPWEERTGRQLALRLRTAVGVAAIGLGPVLKSLDSVIAWVGKT